MAKRKVALYLSRRVTPLLLSTRRELMHARINNEVFLLDRNLATVDRIKLTYSFLFVMSRVTFQGLFGDGMESKWKQIGDYSR